MEKIMSKISQEDMDEIKRAKVKSTILALSAEKALLESQKADLEQKNIVLNVYVKYGLGVTDQILDDGTVKEIAATTERTNE